ncbi:MAG: hypothetical protein AB7O38_09295, partial [Pirellulaceae bacterium]
MHGPVNPEEFLHHISGFVGLYFLAMAFMNAYAAFHLWTSGRATRLLLTPLGYLTTAHVWLVVSLAFTVMGGIALGGGVRYLGLHQSVRDGIDALMKPETYTLGTFVVLTVAFLLRRFLVQPMVAWTLLNLALLFMGLSITDPDFASIVTKPDNVPIVAMIFLLGFFTWLSAYR